MIKSMKNVNSFQIAKVQSLTVAQHLLDFFFCQIQPGVAYKKACIRSADRISISGSDIQSIDRISTSR